MILTEEQRLIRESARRFAQERLAPHAAEWERAAAFPRAVISELGDLGFMGLTVPIEWGGAGADYVAYALALEEIAAGDGAISTVVSGHNSVGVMPILAYGSEAQKERYLRDLASGRKLSAFCLTEPQGGSDAAAIRTRARREGDSYVLAGTKQFITSGATADVALVFAVTDSAAGKRGMSAFIVDTKTPGYVVARIEKKMGQNASDTCEIQLQAARQLTLHAAALKSAGEPSLVAASMAKLVASETAEKICSDAIQTLGGAGYMQDFGVERIYRAVRGAKIYEGTNDIQRLVISRSLIAA
jgi:butyryl-CoA dehydrogenase